MLNASPAFLLLLAAPLAPALHDTDEFRAGSTHIGEPYYPSMGNGGYDVQHYDLVLDVAMPAKTIEATATIRARALHGLTAFSLDLYGLEVLSVQVDGRDADFERGGWELTVTPAAPLEAGTEFVVRVAYRGEPRPAPDAAAGNAGWYPFDSGIYVSSQCAGAPSWFPCNDHQRDKATVALRVTAPKPYVVASNGVGSQQDHGDSRTYSFTSSEPMAPYLVTLAIAEFDVVKSEGPHGLPIVDYFPTDSTPEELAAFERQDEIIEFFESCFGPYPFETAGAIVSYEFLGGALETQTRPIYSRGLPESVVAHEIAHQWFGDYVSADSWADMWLNEGFATYGAFLWLEYAEGQDAAESDARERYAMLRRNAIGPPPDPGVRGIFSARSYERGAWVLHTLRLELDDLLFFDILSTWLEENANGLGTTEEFVAHCERVAGRSLEEFFAGVLYAPVIPWDERFE